MNHISLKGVRINGNIGLSAQEQMLEQELYVDLDLYYNFEAITQSDQIKDGINYQEVISYLRNTSESIQSHTLEYFANHIAEEIKKHFSLEKLNLALECTRYNEELDLDEIKIKIYK